MMTGTYKTLNVNDFIEVQQSKLTRLQLSIVYCQFIIIVYYPTSLLHLFESFVCCCYHVLESICNSGSREFVGFRLTPLSDQIGCGG